MKIEESIKIIETLIEGINPSTGKPLPKRSPLDDPNIKLALTTCTKFIEKQVVRINNKTLKKQKDNIKNGVPKNSGTEWTFDSETRLKKLYSKGCNIDVLAKKFHRKKGGIISRLKGLGLINAQEAEIFRGK